MKRRNFVALLSTVPIVGPMIAKKTFDKKVRKLLEGIESQEIRENDPNWLYVSLHEGNDLEYDRQKAFPLSDFITMISQKGVANKEEIKFTKLEAPKTFTHAKIWHNNTLVTLVSLKQEFMWMGSAANPELKMISGLTLSTGQVPAFEKGDLRIDVT